MTLGKKAEVTLFLIRFKMEMQKCFRPIPRRKNMESIARLGIGIDDIKDTVYQLTYKDYVSGPSEDFDNKGYNVWVFGATVCGYELYIKLSDDFSGNEAKCLSFHEPESECHYPFK